MGMDKMKKTLFKIALLSSLAGLGLFFSGNSVSAATNSSIMSGAGSGESTLAQWMDNAPDWWINQMAGWQH